ncbi:MAG: hypothetical protein MI741_00975, partial [Rhodospirillales bacterium]|nr:hypothetical protein [Rhodospirillales bacterium]
MTGRADDDFFQRRRNEIRRSVQNTASDHWQRLRERREAELESNVLLAEVLQPVAEEYEAHVVLADIDERAVDLIRGFIAEAEHDDAVKIWSEVELRKQMHRRYPAEAHRVSVDRSTLPTPLQHEEPLNVHVEGIGLHILGLMRDVWWEDIERKPLYQWDEQGRLMVRLDGYRDGDRTGSFGIEASMEDRLRGTRGKVIRNISTGREERIEPRQGRDVRLTIDIDLQASIAALLDPKIGLTKAQVWHGSPQVTETKTPKIGEPLNGTAVVMEVATGEILAAVSNPRMSYELLREDPEKIYKDELNRPFFNRPFQQAYQPGSTIKPIVLCSAVAARRYGLGEEIFCRGYLDEGHPNRYRCWIFKKYLTGHGALGPAESIARSCNVFYYELGQRMGSKRLVDWFSRFGLGSPTGCGLKEETGGDLPDLARADERGAPGFARADAIFMGIGQGPVRWTPVQAASAYATLARDGRYLQPTLVRDADRMEPRVGRDLRLHPIAVQEALQGLYDVVHASYGTGRYLHKLDREPIFNAEGVTIYGKSGTAEGVPLRAVEEYNEQGFPVRYGPILREGDHSWFIAMVAPEGQKRPTHVITVVT